MNHMHNPPHPGETLRDDVLPGPRADGDRRCQFPWRDAGGLVALVEWPGGRLPGDGAATAALAWCRPRRQRACLACHASGIRLVADAKERSIDAQQDQACQARRNSRMSGFRAGPAGGWTHSGANLVGLVSYIDSSLRRSNDSAVSPVRAWLRPILTDT